jgi:hypothetical protein
MISPITSRELAKAGPDISKKEFISVFNERMKAELGVKKLKGSSYNEFMNKAAGLLNSYSLDYRKGLESFLKSRHAYSWKGDVKESDAVKEDGIITPEEIELLQKIPGTGKVVSKKVFDGEPAVVHTTRRYNVDDYGRSLHIFNKMYISAKQAVEKGETEDSVYGDYYWVGRNREKKQGCLNDDCDKRRDFYSISDYEKYISK